MTGSPDRLVRVDLPDGVHRCVEHGLIDRGSVAECHFCTPRYIAHPEMPFRAYGVDLSTIGEEGSWVALGHAEPRRMVAAMRKAGRSVYSLTARYASDDTFGDGWDDLDALLGEVEHKRATFVEHPEYGWWCDAGDDAQSHDRAVDVTLWWV